MGSFCVSADAVQFSDGADDEAAVVVLDHDGVVVAVVDLLVIHDGLLGEKKSDGTVIVTVHPHHLRQLCCRHTRNISYLGKKKHPGINDDTRMFFNNRGSNRCLLSGGRGYDTALQAVAALGRGIQMVQQYAGDAMGAGVHRAGVFGFDLDDLHGAFQFAGVVALVEVSEMGCVLVCHGVFLGSWW